MKHQRDLFQGHVPTWCGCVQYAIVRFHLNSKVMAGLQVSNVTITRANLCSTRSWVKVNLVAKDMHQPLLD